MSKILYLFLTLSLLAFGASSQDTFSITAVDTLTGEMGSAGASCIGAPQIQQGCYILSDVKPGIGVIHTQAYYTPQNQNYASSLMNLGVPPEDMIDSLVAHDIQNNPSIRQYGIVDFYTGSPRTAAYTGVNCDDYKNHIIGPNYTIQGNILLGQQILDSMEVRFLETEGPLACRLMAALQGAKVIGADTRCLDDGTSSLSAFLRVAQPDDPEDSLYLDLNVPSTPAGMDPIDSLQTLVDVWGGCYVSKVGPGQEEVIRVFPNPASGMIMVRVANGTLVNGEISLFNQQGACIYERKDLNGPEVTISENLPSGLYLYRITDKNGLSGEGKILVR